MVNQVTFQIKVILTVVVTWQDQMVQGKPRWSSEWVIRKRPINQSTAGCNRTLLHWIEQSQVKYLQWRDHKPFKWVEGVECWSYPTGSGTTWNQTRPNPNSPFLVWSCQSRWRNHRRDNTRWKLTLQSEAWAITISTFNKHQTAVKGAQLT